MPTALRARPALVHALFVVALFAGTVLLFARSTGHGFVGYDDPIYVTANPHVQAGLTWSGVVWAFTAPTDYWHPLTWLSHQLDWQLYGAAPFGHHLGNVLWHALNAVLVFLLFRRLLRSDGLAAFAAALFAWHPLRVESVAWITERKDVMSGAFFLLTLLAYLHYAERRAAARPARAAYLLTLASFAAGLMSKPMLVTVPLVLLVLDFWPLRRLADLGRLRPLLREKIPFFVLSGAAAVATIALQRREGAFVLDLPLAARAGNAVVSLARYLGKFLWPVDLVICYPHPGFWPLPVMLAALGLAIGLTWLAWRQRHPRPWLLAGWLWFVIVLLPVLGLVQVGFQAMADRYSYLALLGVEFALLASLPALTTARARLAAGTVAASLLAAGALQTWTQQAVWRDTTTLFAHAVAVSSPNAVAEDFLAYALLEQGRLDDAGAHAERACALNPRNVSALFTLANVRERQQRPAEAATLFRAVLALRADHALARFHLALLELARGDTDGARALLVAALRADPTLRENVRLIGRVSLEDRNPATALLLHECLLATAPDDDEAHFGAALAATALGRIQEAGAHYRAVAPRSPDFAAAQAALGSLLLAQGDADAALPPLRTATARLPHRADLSLALARAATQVGRTDEASAALDRTSAAAPEDASVQAAVAESYARLRDFRSAARHYRRTIALAPDNAAAHAGLGYMLVLTGDRPAALAAWERALQLQPDFPRLREQIEALRRR